ncbi:MAG: methyltransferase domain-containing protein [Spirochaetaceae bacterium]|nr:methyltransferase domain-containing protein [Spirochaetaceae bacterium]MDT8299672.1 methyltransferase domain-containing protein [Spirochaetaceae bacterium]
MDELKSQNWWSDGEFWQDFKPLMFDKERVEDASGDVDSVIALTGARAPSKVLDVGCGPGRHSVELARRGFHVTGIDIHEPYLREAEKASCQLERNPRFLKEDMRDFSFDEPFGGAISMFQSLGYFDDPEDDLRTCRSIFNALESGGWLIVEMDGKEVAASNFEERTWLERDGRLILLEYSADAAWTRLRNRWMFRDTDGSWHETEFSYRLFSALELGRLLEEAGFSSIEFFGGMDARPYDQNARRLVALAKRA